MATRLLLGDCRATLSTLAAGSVQAVVTSPPYFGLRDYGTPPLVWGGEAEHEHEWLSVQRLQRSGVNHDGGAGYREREDRKYIVRSDQCSCGAWLGNLGLEPDPELYVEHIVDVFREVWRVLRDDGVLWLNMGDSYAGSGKGPSNSKQPEASQIGSSAIKRRNPAQFANGQAPTSWVSVPHGLKPKDLMQMPFRVARALQQPYYLGRVKSEIDRAWLAAMIDGEGCIYIGKQPAGHLSGRNMTPRKQAVYQLGLTVTNLSRVIVDRCAALTGIGSVREVQRPQYDRPGYVWTIGNSNARSLLIELYPYLVAKQQQARLAIGCPPSGAIADASYEAVKLLHKTDAASFDVAPPKTEDLWEPGWWLRSVIPWVKRNSMPESASDRPSTAVEYVFLLAKSARYYWDADAVRVNGGLRSSWAAHSGKQGETGMETASTASGRRYSGFNQRWTESVDAGHAVGGRNRRNGDWFFESWQGLLLDEDDDPLALVVNPAGFAGAHFATFPPKLVEPMVKASTSEKGQCPECGAPWVRVTTTEYVKSPKHGASSQVRKRSETVEVNGWAGMPRLDRRDTTTGWRPSCAHADLTPVPQTVLDPFGGSGTVGLVADRLGRNAVLCELSETYSGMGVDRITGDSPLFVDIQSDSETTTSVSSRATKSQGTPRNDGSRWNNNNGRGFA